jgi:hypothetical protein
MGKRVEKSNTGEGGTATSASPVRLFSRVGLVQTDSRGRLLETTMIDLMWP